MILKILKIVERLKFVENFRMFFEKTVKYHRKSLKTCKKLEFNQKPNQKKFSSCSKEKKS
jgi:hypothetical protein